MIALLIAMPVISLVPTLIFLFFIPDGGADNINWQIFIGSTPLFWVPHFAAGMLMSRIFAISRFEQAWREKPKPWFALGDASVHRAHRHRDDGSAERAVAAHPASRPADAALPDGAVRLRPRTRILLTHLSHCPE